MCVKEQTTTTGLIIDSGWIQNTTPNKRQVNPSFHILIAVADLGFPRGGGANSPGGAPTYNFAKISQKLHEIERIWTPRGGARPKFYYVDPPLDREY